MLFPQLGPVVTKSKALWRKKVHDVRSRQGEEVETADNSSMNHSLIKSSRARSS